MANAHHTVLYTGVTNDLRRRTLEHKAGKGGGFSRKYNLTKLVFFECGDDIRVAIAREKQLKGGSRRKKMELVKSTNPEWKDLFEELVTRVALRAVLLLSSVIARGALPRSNLLADRGADCFTSLAMT